MKKLWLKKLHSFVCLKLYFSKERRYLSPNRKWNVRFVISTNTICSLIKDIWLIYCLWYFDLWVANQFLDLVVVPALTGFLTPSQGMSCPCGYFTDVTLHCMDAPLLNIVLMGEKKYIFFYIFLKNFLSLVILCMEKKFQIFRIKIDRVRKFLMARYMQIYADICKKSR